MYSVMYDRDFYKTTYTDMAVGELNNDKGIIVIDKGLFSLKKKKSFKIKFIIKNGEPKKIKICAPYNFIVKLFEMFNYKDLTFHENSYANKHNLFHRYRYIEEWYNPHYNYEDDLPF